MELCRSYAPVHVYHEVPLKMHVFSKKHVDTKLVRLSLPSAIWTDEWNSIYALDDSMDGIN